MTPGRGCRGWAAVCCLPCEARKLEEKRGGGNPLGGGLSVAAPTGLAWLGHMPTG